MPASDILNPEPKGWDKDILDNMNPNYGFTRKRPATRLTKKAIGGVPYTRETANSGHSFSFSWLSRSWPCVQRLKRYYEQYEDGFFTLIDWDGGGRHYVGRFTTEVVPTETSNGHWDVQNVMFEEMPTVAMLQYPNDWDNDSINFGVCNDFGDQKVASSGVWALNVQASQDGNYFTLDNAAGSAGDWAQYEYRGYGFRLNLRKGPEYGIVGVYLDGVLLVNVDCYAAADIGPQQVLVQESLPLDFHRVQVMCTATKNAAATACGASWVSLDVMR